MKTKLPKKKKLTKRQLILRGLGLFLLCDYSLLVVLIVLLIRVDVHIRALDDALAASDAFFSSETDAFYKKPEDSSAIGSEFSDSAASVEPIAAVPAPNSANQDSGSDAAGSDAGVPEPESELPENVSPYDTDRNYPEDEYAAQNLADYVSAPVDYEDHEVLEKLYEMTLEDETYQQIFERSYFYPYGMIKNMVNNPELTNYVLHFEGIQSEASGGITDAEKELLHPLFLQWDERWAYVPYGNNIMGVAGCGPTCLSMVLFSFTRDENLTPDYCGDFAMEKGFYLYGTGTMWALFEKGPSYFGIKSRKVAVDRQAVTDALKDGKMLVFSVGPGDFTAYGHFIVVYGIDEDGLLKINDPNSVYRSTVHWDFDQIKGQIKGIWSFEEDNN